MPAKADEDSEDRPLDPAVERVRKRLVRFVAINLGLLAAALMAVVAALVYKTGREASAPEAAATAPAAGPMVGDILLPAGARLVSQSLSGNRIALDAELADGSRALFLYDIGERRIVGRFALKAQ
jgi:hypothetical protein